MYQFVLIIHILACVSLITLVIVQQGKGATVGSAFGSGASQTVFGSRGSGSVLLKITIGFVIVFFSTSMAMNFMASRAVKQVKQIELPALPAAPSQQSGSAPVTPNSIPNN